MSEQYENNKCLVHLIFWSHPWSLHPLTYKHNYITFNDHITIHNTHKTKHTVEYKLQQLQLKSICVLWMSSASYLVWSGKAGGCYWTMNMLWSCLRLLHTVDTAPWRWWHRTVTTGAAALDNWTHTSHPRLTIRGQLEAGAGARPRGARPASSLLTTPPSTALVTLTLATEDLERWGPVTNISQFSGEMGQTLLCNATRVEW